MINYLSASDSQLQLWDDEGIVASSSDALILSNIIHNNGGLADEIFASSSMDFASEEGFTTDDGAKELFDSAVSLYNDLLMIHNG